MNRKKLILIVLGLGGVAYYLMTRKKGVAQPQNEPFDYGFGEEVNNTLNNPSSGCPPGIITGCTQPEATNYNPCANNPAPATCTYPPGVIQGCMNPNAQNYNPMATINAPSQCLSQGMGTCGDPDACNYSPGSITSLGSCIYPTSTEGGNKNNCQFPAFIGYAGSLSNYSDCITCDEYTSPEYIGPL